MSGTSVRILTLVGAWSVMAACNGSVAASRGEVPEAGAADGGTTIDAGPRIAERVASGACLLSAIAGANGCTGIGDYLDCAAESCGLHGCDETCGPEYTSCLATLDDPCTESCSTSDACSACVSGLASCSLQQCQSRLACGKVTPGGPCSKIEACCQRQGPNATRCLALVQTVEQLSGDLSCTGLMMDQDFLTNLANVKPCAF
jgi:hypothetical protein